MEPRHVSRLVVVLAAAVLFAAADCHGDAPAGLPEGPGAYRAPDTAEGMDNGPTGPAVPLHAGPDLSRSPENAVARECTDTAPPVSHAGATETPAIAAGGPGEESDLREPSFGKESPPVAIADPIEPVNRGIFYVNDKLYRWVLKPVAKGYKYVVPEGVRTAVRNFFLNLGTPVRAANTLLQGKFRATGTELARFGINSTIGMGGLFDAAKEWNLHRKDEDAGQTLGVYGLGHGMYIVLPVLGPSSARDAVGTVGDAFLDPLMYLTSTEGAIGARVVRTETDLAFRIDEYDQLTGAAVDPYIAVRDAYLQYREKRVKE